MPLPRLVRIVQRPDSFPLPRLPRGVKAVLVDDTRLVPLLDLHMFLEIDVAQENPEYVVFADSEFGTIALPAQETCGIVAEHKGQVNYLASVHPSIKAGEFDYLQNRFIIIDIDCLTMRLTQAFH